MPLVDAPMTHGRRRGTIAKEVFVGMRIFLIVGFVTAAIASAGAQPAQPNRKNPTGPPTLADDDTEGLVLSPNPAIRHAWKRKVFWRTETESPLLQPGVPAATAAERAEMTRNADAVVALLKATPTGSNGEGFWVSEGRQYRSSDAFTLPPGVALTKYPLLHGTGVYPFYHEDVLTNGVWRKSIKGETTSVYYSFNELPGSLHQPIVAAEPAVGERNPVELYLRPRETARLAGLPIYEDDLLFIARAGRDPWTTVSVGRAINAALPRYQKDKDNAERRLADLRQKNVEIQSDAWEKERRDYFEKTNGALRTTRPSNYQARLASLESDIKLQRKNAAAAADPQRDANGFWYWNPIDALERAQKTAALPPSEAAKPACYVAASDTRRPDGSRDTEGRNEARGDIVAVGTAKDCREIVITNHAYFDLTMPRSAPQSLLVSKVGRCAEIANVKIGTLPRVTDFEAPPEGCYQHLPMWNEVDWTKIVALIRP